MKRSWSWQVKGVAIGVGVTVFGLFIGWCMAGLATVTEPLYFSIITCLTYLAVGMALAPLVFKEKHFLLAVFLSLGTFLLLRCILIVGMFHVLQFKLEEQFHSAGSIFARAFWVVLIQSVCIYLTLLVGVWILKKTEVRFGGAELIDIEVKPKAEEGTCSACGKRTVIAAEREILSFLGMKKRYLCQHCLSFIRGNPVVAILEAISQIVIGSVIFVGVFVNIATVNSNNQTYIWVALLALGSYALGGLRKLIASCWGVFKVKH